MSHHKKGLNDDARWGSLEDGEFLVMANWMPFNYVLMTFSVKCRR